MAKKKRAVKPNEDYIRHLKQLNAERPWESASHLVLGCDPGSRNFGISLVGIENNWLRVYANSVLMNPVNDLIKFDTAAKNFIAELRLWMAAKPVGIAAERFQTRGNGGPLIEQVSSMLGLMKGQFKVPVKLTIASTWKNRFNKRFNVDLKELYPKLDIQPHQLDATLIGVFGLEEGLGRTIDYKLDDLIDMATSTSLIRLKSEKALK